VLSNLIKQQGREVKYISPSIARFKRVEVIAEWVGFFAIGVKSL
jgi:hypothetical protein